VHAAFGLSDAGDPWCVVANDADEMLVHVARIGGRIVVHDAVADVVRTGSTLWSAFDPILGGAREGRSETAVVPLNGSQTLITLAAAILLEQAMEDRPQTTASSTSGAPAAPAGAHGLEGGATGAPEDPAKDGHSETSAARAAARSDNEVATQAHAGGVGHSSPPSAVATAANGQADGRAPAESANKSAAAGIAQGASHGLPTHAAAAIPAPEAVQVADRNLDSPPTHAGPGASYVGSVDLRTVTAADDHVTLGPHTVAVGGTDHTVFVAPVATSASTVPQTQHPLSIDSATPAGAADPGHPSGVVLNFTAQDEFQFVNAAKGEIVSVVAVADVLAGLHSASALQGFAVTPGVEVGFDLDGDKVADVYLMVAGPGVGALHVGTVSATGTGGPAAALDTPDPHVGHTLHGTDFLFS
jgi:hypothetical protein